MLGHGEVILTNLNSYLKTRVELSRGLGRYIGNDFGFQYVLNAEKSYFSKSCNLILNSSNGRRSQYRQGKLVD